MEGHEDSCSVGEVAGEAAVGELRHSHVNSAPLLCSVSLTCGPNWLEGPACQSLWVFKDSSFVQFLNAVCEFCISILVDPNGVIQILVESQ